MQTNQSKTVAPIPRLLPGSYTALIIPGLGIG